VALSPKTARTQEKRKRVVQQYKQNYAECLRA